MSEPEQRRRHVWGAGAHLSMTAKNPSVKDKGERRGDSGGEDKD